MSRRSAFTLVVSSLLLAAALGVTTSVAAGGGCHGALESEARPSEAAAAVVKIDGCTFAPTVARVPAGTEVRFLNSSQSFHDIVGRDRAWGTEALDVGREYRHQFVDEGLYPFSCSLHPGMAGVVIVGSPAVAAEQEVAPVAASEPVPDATATSDSTVPMIAVGTASLLAGAAIGVLGARAVGRRNEAA